MIAIKFEDKATPFFKEIVDKFPSALDNLLDDAARRASILIKAEAPYKTGLLLKDISVTAPAKNIREIEPVAKNPSGGKYAYWVEKGTEAGGDTPSRFPNLANIQAYMGVSKGVAWAIAYSIAREGTRANPFMTRAYVRLKQEVEKDVSKYFGVLKVTR